MLGMMVRDYSSFLPGAAAAPPSPLQALGWQAHFSGQLSPEDLSAGQPMRITRVDRAALQVAGAAGEATLPGMTDVAVGDWLLVPDDGAPRLLERKSVLRRIAAGRVRYVQLIAANIDTAFVTTSCNADFNVARLERYLALAFEAGTDPVILLTKADLDDPAPFLDQARAISGGVPVLAVNAKGDSVAQDLSPWCKPGRTVAFLGSSGVGKSTLLNALWGEDKAETGAIRDADARGRHTTTARELHVLPAGFAVLDTPGMRELQLTDVASGIEEVFADIADLARSCKFSDCAHETEPGCAVRAALDAGDINAERLARWKKLAAEDAYNSADMAERRRRDKAFGKMVNKAVKAKRR